jgi:hypothetical protein
VTSGGTLTPHAAYADERTVEPRIDPRLVEKSTREIAPFESAGRPRGVRAANGVTPASSPRQAKAPLGVTWSTKRARKPPSTVRSAVVVAVSVVALATVAPDGRQADAQEALTGQARPAGRMVPVTAKKPAAPIGGAKKARGKPAAPVARARKSETRRPAVRKPVDRIRSAPSRAPRRSAGGGGRTRPGLTRRAAATLPVLRWPSIGVGTLYRVEVSTARSGREQVILTLLASGNQLEVPGRWENAGRVLRLEPGRYRWSVRTQRHDGRTGSIIRNGWFLFTAP